MASLLLLVPIFYIYKSFTGSDVNDLNIEYSKKPVESKSLLKTNNDKSSKEIPNNEEIVDTESNDIVTSTDNAFVKEGDLDSLTDELYKDKQENTVSVSNLDEIEEEAIVRKQNLGYEIEEAVEDRLHMAGDAEIASVKIDESVVDNEIAKNEEIVDTQSGDIDTGTDNTFVKEQVNHIRIKKIILLL